MCAVLVTGCDDCPLANAAGTIDGAYYYCGHPAASEAKWNTPGVCGYEDRRVDAPGQCPLAVESFVLMRASEVRRREGGT